MQIPGSESTENVSELILIIIIFGINLDDRLNYSFICKGYIRMSEFMNEFIQTLKTNKLIFTRIP